MYRLEHHVTKKNRNGSFGKSRYWKSSPHRVLTVLMSLILLCTALPLSGCGTPEQIQRTGFYFDTVITITLYGEENAPYLDDCMTMANHYEKLFSATIPDSDVSRINAAAGSPVTVDEETVALLEKGLEYCELSNGAFDITIGRLSSLWHFSDNEGDVPSETDISTALATVDYHAVQIDGTQVTLTNPDAAIDLGGIAKGYIADRMKEYLTEQGVASGHINLGGNVLTLGEKSDHSPYTIGIQKPFAEDNSAYATVKVTDKSVVSSGVYERNFTVDGILYHHILSTATGYPVENNLLGVTIISDESVDGDGLSTVCFSLGLEQGMALIESLPDIEAVFITEDMEAHTTSGIGDEIPFEVL